MWNYTDKVVEHYRNPKNAGFIEDADAIGEAGSLKNSVFQTVRSRNK